MQGVIALLPLLILAVFFLRPRRLRYRVVGGRLWIDKLFGKRVVPLAGVTARRHRPGKVRRVVGTSLPGYQGGRFRLDGRPTLVFASRLDEGVLIEGGALPVFVTPADVDGFLAAVARLSRA